MQATERYEENWLQGTYARHNCIAKNYPEKYDIDGIYFIG